MNDCPRCREELARVAEAGGVSWRCGRCGGRFATLPFLRRHLSPDAVNRVWQDARGLEPGPDAARCPSCGGAMVRLRADGAGGGPGPMLDVCRACQAVWFDRDEFDALPPRPPEPEPAPDAPRPGEGISMEARERLFRLEAARIEREANEADEPLSGWQRVAWLLGLPVKTAGPRARRVPWATLAVAALTTVVSVWGWSDPEVFDLLSLVPSRVGETFGVSLLSSTMLHGGVLHLALNLYALLLFGALVEESLGWRRHLALYLLAGLAGGILHVALDPRGDVPCVGASGCIAGVLAYSALAFPDVRLRVFDLRLVLLLPKGIRFSARTFFWLWLALQLLLVRGQVRGGGDVSALAHLGGAAVGWAFHLALCALPRRRARRALRPHGGRYDRRPHED